MYTYEHRYPWGNFFGGLDDGLLARAEALAAVDISKASSPQLMKPDGFYGHDLGGHNPANSRPPQMSFHSYGPTDSMLDQLQSAPPTGAGMPLSSMPEHHPTAASTHHSHHGPHGPHGPHPLTHQMYPPVYSCANTMNTHHPMSSHHNMHHVPMHDMDCDPRELEAFAERFKQRRIKLGVTQADVGSALAKLKLPGVGALSQSTICRFESLTLSHNNMIALKPILQAWLEEAEKQARERKMDEDGMMACNGDKKRKRTSIAAPEKRSLEAYFAVQPRPSGEKIAQIAEKLDLKKNVVRVWFCNQRQKQKRMKFSAVNH
ncbi:inhibitory POU protein-like isoform X2 [Liolophura sinensis]|uniref:inhibitory POU protein-like isoform X2 n=1 Tax=Liolophura sinensis TaxID=3198878 RepID=UPI003158C436